MLTPEERPGLRTICKDHTRPAAQARGDGGGDRPPAGHEQTGIHVGNHKHLIHRGHTPGAFLPRGSDQGPSRQPRENGPGCHICPHPLKTMGQAASQEHGGIVKTHMCSQRPPTGPHARPLAVGPGRSVSLWPARGRGRRRSPPAGACPGRGTRRWPRAAPGVRPGQRQGVLTCCRASGRPLTTGSGRCPRPWLSSCDERADGGLGHAQAGSAVLPPGGAVPQHSGAVAASPAPMDPKPPSRRKAEGPDAATRLAAALHALLWGSHRWGRGPGGCRAQRLLALGAGCARLREPRTGPCLCRTLTGGPVPALGL